jgi:hypothetical protein
MKPSAILLLLAATGCADEATSEDLTTVSAPLTVLSHDCDVEAGYGLSSFTSADAGKLQIVGIYEARNGDAPWWSDPECMACLEDQACSADPEAFAAVCDQEPKPHAATLHVTGNAETFVLASYEPTNWTITVDPGASLERILVSSYGGSTAVAPAGITVEQADLGYAYEWLSDEELARPCTDFYPQEACDAFGDSLLEERMAARNLVAKAEALSGDKLATFHGCYSMSTISFGADAK